MSLKERRLLQPGAPVASEVVMLSLVSRNKGVRFCQRCFGLDGREEATAGQAEGASERRSSEPARSVEARCMLNIAVGLEEGFGAQTAAGRRGQRLIALLSHRGYQMEGQRSRLLLAVGASMTSGAVLVMLMLWAAAAPAAYASSPDAETASPSRNSSTDSSTQTDKSEDYFHRQSVKDLVASVVAAAVGGWREGNGGWRGLEVGFVRGVEEIWVIFGPGGKLHPAYFLEHFHGHIMVSVIRGRESMCFWSKTMGVCLARSGWHEHTRAVSGGKWRVCCCSSLPTSSCNPPSSLSRTAKSP
eukprot:1159014-Pelagomonas_calceolata.AAC.13